MADFNPKGGETGPVRRARRGSGEIRSLIISAARAVFAERGFAGATTRQIADRAVVAEPLIFNNFGGKAQLFAAAVIEPFNDRLSALIAASDSGIDADREGRSAHFVHLLYPFLRENSDLLHALVKSSGDMDSDALHGLDGYFAAAEARMREAFIRAGWEFDVEPGLVVRHAFGMLAGAVLFREWFFPGEAPVDEAQEFALARMLFKATEPPRGSGSARSGSSTPSQ
ncbi:helix-turn-helix domain-containing protein [Sphingopyxis sp. CCNWLW253]|uniref:TetR/AcrR family transcriptional regulator n=1 Tax=unclassified Sphingopyxis TaxID=2614943 RepID=UPI00301306C6